MISCCIMDRNTRKNFLHKEFHTHSTCRPYFFVLFNTSWAPIAVLEKSPLLQTKEKESIAHTCFCDLQMASLSRLPLSSCTFSCSLCCPLLPLTPPYNQQSPVKSMEASGSLFFFFFFLYRRIFWKWQPCSDWLNLASMDIVSLVA